MQWGILQPTFLEHQSFFEQLAPLQAWPVVEEQYSSPFLLDFDGDRWVVQHEGWKDFYLDFDAVLMKYARQIHALKMDPLIKALALNKGEKTVLDATFGAGNDALMMLIMGAKVTGCEQNLMMKVLITDALNHGQHEALKRLQFFPLSFEEYLEGHEQSFDCAYFDPMFESSRHKSLSQKSMQLLHEVAGTKSDEDNLSLLQSLKERASRVVVKRAGKSAALLDKPTAVFQGKSIRYDMYC